jgi:hypothetical protein
MDQVFLSYHFEPWPEYLTAVRDIIESHGIRIVSGVDLGGGQLYDEVQTRIRGAGALIGLLSRDQALENGRYRPAAWIEAEVQFARDQKIPTIALTETLVDASPLWPQNERIDLDAASPMPALLKLSRTIGVWRLLAGRTLRVRLDSAPANVSLGANVSFTYRRQRLGKIREWVEAPIIPEPGGIFAFLQGIQDDEMFQLRLATNGKVWLSPFTPKTS